MEKLLARKLKCEARLLFREKYSNGPTPSGKFIAASFFSERIPIPQREVYALKADGVVGEIKPDKTETRHALVREIDATILFDIDLAIKLRAWLDGHIAQMQKVRP